MPDDDDRLGTASFDLSDLMGKARRRVGQGLARTQVVERARQERCAAVFRDTARPEHFLSQLAQGVRALRLERRILAQGFGGLAIDHGRSRDAQTRLHPRLTQRFEQVMGSENVDL